ncbi:ECF transporter S component [Leucobacter sp. G161]|uniref:ECF transporter S component n=1 Tax=Leucobacter sp. G161 TaxID=663704 RepID=UPI00073CB3A7|nr:ECF transporter S component [Leucobacter sp. G161]KUF05820.1 hypothetical protein AUL38_03040 [Leucobacter sp. G161]
MVGSSTSGQEHTETFDEIVADLHTLREQAGPVSYAEIVRRIFDLRIARGVNEAAAAPPRSTVYNVFTEGRARLDTELVRDIVLALGVTEDEAEQWVDRCRAAQRVHPAVEPVSVPPALSSGKIRPPVSDRIQLPAGPIRPPLGVLILVLLLCICVSVAGNVLVRALGLPIYLDMVGTAIAAIALGPWYGVLAAVVTALAGTLYMDSDFLFALVGITGALVWGYGVRRFRMGDTFARFLVLGLIVAAASSLMATPLLVLRHGGSFGEGQVNMTGSLLAAGVPLLGAVFTVNIITSLIDKLLTSYIALAVLPLLRRWFGVSLTHIPVVGQLHTPGPPAEGRESPDGPELPGVG